MKKVMVTVIGFLVLGGSHNCFAGGEEMDFSIEDAEKAIEESQPEKLRELAQGITLSKVDKENLLKKAQNISKNLRKKLKKSYDGKDKMRIVKGIGSGVMSLFYSVCAGICGYAICQDIRSGSDRRDPVFILLLLAGVGLGGISAGTFGSIANSQIRKGRSKFDRNNQLNQALATEAELNGIVAQ
jgi:hypothetical protein